MHVQAYQAIQRLISVVPIIGQRVLEVGGFNVNGSVAPLFVHATAYDVLDLRDGPGVTIVADICTYTPGQPYNLVVCCEVLEHMPDPVAGIAAMRRCLVPGGTLLLTCASHERQPHGVDGGAVGRESYTRITPDELRGWLHDWQDVTVEHNPRAGDLYVHATRPTEPARKPRQATRRAPKRARASA